MIKIYVIYDMVADFYSQPFYLKNDLIAKREITTLVNDQSQPNIFNTNTKDKVLYSIGEFDENTAEIVPTKKTKIFGLSELIAPTKE